MEQKMEYEQYLEHLYLMIMSACANTVQLN